MDNISFYNTLNVGTQVAKMGCYVAAAGIIGKKVYHGVAAGAFKAAEKVANLVGQDTEYFCTQSATHQQAARKDLSKNLAVAGGLVVAGLACEQAEDAIAYAKAGAEADAASFVSTAKNVGVFVVTKPWALAVSVWTAVPVAMYNKVVGKVEVEVKEELYVAEKVTNAVTAFLATRLTRPVAPAASAHYYGMWGPANQASLSANVNWLASMPSNANAWFWNTSAGNLTASAVNFVWTGSSSGIPMQPLNATQLLNATQPLTATVLPIVTQSLNETVVADVTKSANVTAVVATK